MSRRDDLEAVRKDLRKATDIDAAVSSIGEEGAYVLRRFLTAQAADTSGREYLGATFALLGIEVSARLAVMAQQGLLESDEASTLIAGVGGALDAADHSLELNDIEGARRFVEAAMDTLNV